MAPGVIRLFSCKDACTLKSFQKGYEPCGPIKRIAPPTRSLLQLSLTNTLRLRGTCVKRVQWFNSLKQLMIALFTILACTNGVLRATLHDSVTRLSGGLQHRKRCGAFRLRT